MKTMKLTWNNRESSGSAIQLSLQTCFTCYTAIVIAIVYYNSLQNRFEGAVQPWPVKTAESIGFQLVCSLLQYKCPPNSSFSGFLFMFHLWQSHLCSHAVTFSDINPGCHHPVRAASWNPRKDISPPPSRTPVPTAGPTTPLHRLPSCSLEPRSRSQVECWWTSNREDGAGFGTGGGSYRDGISGVVAHFIMKDEINFA